MPNPRFHLPESFEFEPKQGVLRFAKQRAVVMGAESLGFLGRQLAERIGSAAARALLTQWGFAQGWQLAGAIKDRAQNEDLWRKAGEHFGPLLGLFQSRRGFSQALLPAGLHLSRSYEAEQHLAHSGKSDHGTCATLGGFLSGYLSRTSGTDIIAVEGACLACGDKACQFFARTRQEWLSRPPEFESVAFFEHLDLVGRLAKEARENHGPSARPKAATSEGDQVARIVTRSPLMRATVDLALRLAGVDSTVLITGESGTGKERIARLIHDRSARREMPFIAVNCGAIAENLLESELFGHARGSFTGAIQAHAGIFEAANHGTILLDEIGEVSPGMQIKLLRVLQERQVRRVGEESSREVDFRVIAATNKDLAQQVELGLFRRDLYYRIHVVEVPVPALRDRREDVLPLAMELLTEAAVRMKRELVAFSPAVADKLLQHEWPGNVRELENTMERAVALAAGNRVELSDLPKEVLDESEPSSSKLESVRPLEDVSKDYILAALDFNDGNQARTARQLGIGTATLYRKLKTYGRRDQEIATESAAKRAAEPESGHHSP